MKLKYAVILVLFIVIALVISHLLLPIDIQRNIMYRYTIGTVLYLIFFAGGILALYFIVKLAIKNAIKELNKDGNL